MNYRDLNLFIRLSHQEKSLVGKPYTAGNSISLLTDPSVSGNFNRQHETVGKSHQLRFHFIVPNKDVLLYKFEYPVQNVHSHVPVLFISKIKSRFILYASYTRKTKLFQRFYESSTCTKTRNVPIEYLPIRIRQRII